MELFVVKNKSNEVVKGGFANKEDAKKVRNELQAATKEGIPEKQKFNHRAWSFRVAPGKDHHQTQSK